MRIAPRKRKSGEIEFGLIYGAIALFGLVAANILPLTRVLPSCALRGLTGVPCPACGGTRAVVALSQGEILSAFTLNPLVTVALGGALAVFLVDLAALFFRLPRVSVDLSQREKRVLLVSAAVAVAGQWLYLVVTR